MAFRRPPAQLLEQRTLPCSGILEQAACPPSCANFWIVLAKDLLDFRPRHWPALGSTPHVPTAVAGASPFSAGWSGPHELE